MLDRMDDRPPLHGSPEGLRRPPGPDPMAPIGVSRPLHKDNPAETADYRPAEPCHVWVTTPTGRHPGVLMEWRRVPGQPWTGRVVHADLHEGRWAKVDQWLPAEAIEPA